VRTCSLVLAGMLSAVLPVLPVVVGDFALAGEIVEIRIETVLATNAPQDEDDRLPNMPQWRGAFNYTSYRLVQEERRRVGWGKQVNFFLPGGRLLQVVPKAHTKNNLIALQVMLMEGTTPTSLMNTSLLLPNRGTLFIGGRKHQEGMLLIRIGATAEK
jgi:hypothetical protein